MNLKDKVEKSSLVFFLSSVVASFVTGYFAHKHLTDELKIISDDKIDRLEKSLATFQQENIELQKHIEETGHSKCPDFPSERKQEKQNQAKRPEYSRNHYESVKNNPLYTISAGTKLKVVSDIIISANTRDNYIQNKAIKNKERINKQSPYGVLTLKEAFASDQVITAGSVLSIVRVGEHDLEEREERHAYVYIQFDNTFISNLKFVGKSNLSYPSIADFTENIDGVFQVEIPPPKTLQ